MNLDQYPADPLSEPLSAFLNAEELGAIDFMRASLGVDMTHTFQFWESMVVRITSGVTTPHGCQWDVEIPYYGQTIRIEVKYSQEFWMRFAQGPRLTFKWARPKGLRKEKPADVIVLVGIDALRQVSTWVVPANSFRQCTSITLTSPRARAGRSDRSRGIGDYRCPPTQLLPEVLRSYRRHLSYDTPRRALTRALTRRTPATTGMDALFGEDEA